MPTVCLRSDLPAAASCPIKESEVAVAAGPRASTTIAPYALLPCKVYVSTYVDLGPMQAELDSVWRYLSSGPFKEMKIGTRVSLAYLAHPKQLLLEVTAAVGHHGGEALCCPVFQLSISRYRLGSPHGHGPGQARFRISLHTSKALTLEARARTHTNIYIYVCMHMTLPKSWVNGASSANATGSRAHVSASDQRRSDGPNPSSVVYRSITPWPRGSPR